MRIAGAIALLLCGCAHRLCGQLDAQAMVAFHQSHWLATGANQSAVLDLASEPWTVCVENGVAQIENHPAVGEDPR